MKMKEFEQELIKEHMQSDEEYCAYCMYPRYDKISCCQENHWLRFRDFDTDTQKEFIADELMEYEEWSKKQ